MTSAQLDGYDTQIGGRIDSETTLVSRSGCGNDTKLDKRMESLAALGEAKSGVA
uniref:Uncharacterized protein n=1 Tax=Fagus sylvatica TaxID=28930 RepID=A0A2N9F9F2_FAGSY